MKFMFEFVLFFKDWLVLTPKDRLPKPEVEFFPRPAKCTDGSYIYDRIPPSAQALKALASGSGEGRYAGPQSQLFKKRQYQEKQASNDPPAKIQRTGGTPEPGKLYCGLFDVELKVNIFTFLSFLTASQFCPIHKCS